MVLTGLGAAVRKKSMSQEQEQRPLLQRDEEAQLQQLSSDATSNPRVVSDSIIGLSDGLTVPFALTAGLSGFGNAKVVISGGLCELVSGAISMGLGGFLAAQSEKEHYDAVYASSLEDFENDPDVVARSVEKALGDFGLSDEAIGVVVRDLKRNKEKAARFTLKMVHELEEPAADRELVSAATIGGAYFVGGFIPLVPYFFAKTVKDGFKISCLVMFVTLFVFGYFKAIASMGKSCPQKTRVADGFQQLLVGGLAAAAAWELVRLLDSGE